VSFRIEVDARGLDLDLADKTITMKCPECKTANEVTLGQVRREENIVCAGCHKTIKLIDENHSVGKTISDVNNALDDLKDALENMGAKL